ncbi:DUF2628 domain-containing protein [Mesorhizobium sp. CAU 1741]|uniref:DUF2628 domain-containing protein n=1 Tax=Mesorhizobium sp. CAU 1741 TaxID=3140366 RepID=UPI00325BF3CE
MASYVVMEPPARGSDEAVLVRDGFHFLAFLLPVVWLLFNRLWIETLAVVVAGMVLAAIGSFAGFGNVATIASLMLAVLVGLEASTLKIAALRRRGWREWGVVEANDGRDAEIRYLAGVDEEEPDERPEVPPQPATQTPTRHDARGSGPVLGMLGYPGRG